MITKKNIKRKLLNAKRKLRIALFPTPFEQQRAWQIEEERTNRYEKYIPHYTARTYLLPITWFLWVWFVYFMIFGISMDKHNNTIDTEPFDTANTEINHIEYEPAKQSPQFAQKWNYVMKSLNPDKETYLNYLILLQGTLVGLAPTLALGHRKRIVDKMHAEKWKMINPIDETDRKIIRNMSKDAPNYFYHLTLSLTGPEKMKKYKNIAPSIIRGYMESHPQDKKAAIMLKEFNGKTK